MNRYRFLLALLMTAVALCGPAAADQIVYFVNGKAITVKSIEKGPKITVLEVEGGGRIGVPTEQIERIEELQTSSPAAAPVAPPVTTPVTIPQNPPAAPQTPPPATTAPSGPPPAVGPGVGGKSMDPHGMPTKPLDIGGDEGAAGPQTSASMPNQGIRGIPAARPPQGMARQDGLYGGAGGYGRRSNNRGGGYGRSRPPLTYDQPARGTQAQKPGPPPPGPGTGTQNPPPPPAPPVPPPADHDAGANDDAGAPPPPAQEPDPAETPQDDGGGTEPQSDDDGNQS